MPSFKELFGSSLLKGKENVDVSVLDGKTAVAIYFSAHWCGPCRGFTPKLVESYKKITEAGKSFEIVFASSDQDQASFDDYYGEMPWLALPFDNKDVKNALSKKFKVQGIPTLVILDGEGNTITSNGRSAISEDPTGEKFPWVPPTFDEVLPESTEFVNAKGDKTTLADLKGKTLGLYFSAHWCPPCKAFTPQFASTYKKVIEAGKAFEVIFISSDRDQAAFDEYLSEMPWYALPFDKREQKSQLSSMFEVEGIPSLVILDENRNIINDNGRGAVSGDEDGNNFPWPKPPVMDISAPEDVNDLPTLAILMEQCDAATKESLQNTLTEMANAVIDKAKAAGSDPEFAFLSARSPHSIAGRIRTLAKLEEATSTPSVVILNVPDGNFLKWTHGEVNKENLDKFVEEFKSGKAEMTSFS